MKTIESVECSYNQCQVKPEELYLYDGFNGGEQRWLCAPCMYLNFKEWSKRYIRP